MDERIGEWMQSYSGGAFYPLDPRPDDIRIEDIAHALSMLCRFGGHCLKFYSVAEHSIHVADKAPQELKLQALMHDAAEGYLMDMIHPLKIGMPEYQRVEAKVERAIAAKFDLPYPHDQEIKRLDKAILEDERVQNMTPPPQPWRETGGPLGVELKFWTPRRAKRKFINAFYRYGGKP